MYTVRLNDVAIECATIEEAAELARRLAGQGKQGHAGKIDSGGDHPAGGSSRWTAQRIKEFFENISTQQRKLVETLLQTTDGRTDDQLRTQLGLDSNKALGGVFTGLYKNAKKVGADPSELYVRGTATIGDRQIYEYTLADSFRAAVKQWKH